MTENKPIMIDGVDVSGCKHLYRGIDCLAHMDYSECCEGYNPSYGYCPNTDCYFKQLTRKTQECEELKKERDFYSAEYTRVSTQLMSQDAYILIDGKEVWSGDNRKLKQQLDKLKIAKEQAKQKLERIGKLCDRKANQSSFCNGIENKDMQKLAIRILQIIDEVKKE